VASRDWIKKDYIIQEVPCPLIQDARNIVCPYESTDEFGDESLDAVPIQRQASTYTRCWHLSPSSCLLLSFAAALWCHHCELKLNQHQRCEYYDTVECSGKKPRGSIQSCVGYRVCFGTTGVVLYKSRVVNRVQVPGQVFNMGGKQNGVEGGKMGYIYSSSCNFLLPLVLLVKEHKTAQRSSCTTTRHLMNEKPRNQT
jgi:hypothetical protein